MPFTATRTCNFPAHVGERTLPLSPETFYHRPNGTIDYWCRECVRTYNREQRAARRANGGRNNRKFGVELEVVGTTRHALERELLARGLRVNTSHRGYTHQVSASWKVVTDASVMGGYELVSPPLKGANGLAQLKKACEALDAAGARVNRSCGLHVHHDVGDLNGLAFTRLMTAWSNNQRGTDGLVAPSRRNSQWARPLTPSDLDNVSRIPADADTNGIRRHLGYVDRYRSLNVAAFPRYGTVEVRQHQGTISYDKVAAWIAFGQAFITWAKSGAALTIEGSSDALIDRLTNHGLGAAQATFLKGRAAHFDRSGRRQPVAA